MSNTKFTTDHEWITVDGETGIIGITAYAAGQLGDVVSVELPEVGDTFKKGDELAVVDSVKAASEVYAPVSGEVVAVNSELEDAPEKVNESPDGEGWFVKLKLDDTGELSSLMDKSAYDNHIGE